MSYDFLRNYFDPGRLDNIEANTSFLFTITHFITEGYCIDKCMSCPSVKANGTCALRMIYHDVRNDIAIRINVTIPIHRLYLLVLVLYGEDAMNRIIFETNV